MISDFRDLKEEVEALRYQLRELSDNYREFRKQLNNSIFSNIYNLAVLLARDLIKSS